MTWDRNKADYLLGKPTDIVPWNTTAANPTPVYRAWAWALEAAHTDGARFELTSAIRMDSVLAWFNKEYGTSHVGQAYLYNGWIRRLPGFLPANPPNRTSHCGFQDGSQYYPHVGQALNYINWGIDAVDDGSVNDAAKLVWHLNHVGIRALKAYPGSSAENHHILIDTGALECWTALFDQEKKAHDEAWQDSTIQNRQV